MGWNAVFAGFGYVLTVPFVMSVTVMSTCTFVRPPANTQYRWLKPQPFKTFTTISTFCEEKNQNWPVSLVPGIAVPVPDAVAVCHVAETLKRPLLRQRLFASGVHGPEPRNPAA